MENRIAPVFSLRDNYKLEMLVYDDEIVLKGRFGSKESIRMDRCEGVRMVDDGSALPHLLIKRGETSGSTKEFLFYYSDEQRETIEAIVEFLSEKGWFTSGERKEKEIVSFVDYRYEFFDKNDAIYSIDGARGRQLDVYDDFVTITITPSLGSVAVGNVADGQKVIFYKDCIGLQYKPPGALIGYLQLETAASTMNNKRSNFFNENTFTFESFGKEDIMKEVYRFIFNKVYEIKKG